MDVLLQLQLHNPAGVALALVPLLLNVAILVYSALELPRDRTTRAFGFFVASLIGWQLFDVMVRVAVTEEAAVAWREILRIWQFFVLPASVHFALRVSDHDEIADNSLTAIALYGPPLFFQGTYSARIQDEVLRNQPVWGWIADVDPQPLARFQTVWFASMALITLAILVANLWRPGSHAQRSTRRLLAVGVGLPVGIGLFVEAALPLMGVQQVPITSTTLSIFSMASAVALGRFDLFKVSTLSAARAAISTVSDPVIIASPQGRIVFANDAAVQLAGRPLEEGSVVDLLPEADREAFQAGPWRAGLEGQRLGGVELHLLDGAGLPVPVLASLAPLPIRRRGQPGIVLVAHDVSTLRSAMEAVEAASHAKSAFLANMSHELRTPLNAIIGYAQLLGEDVDDPQSQADLGRIESSGRYLLDLINDVLDLSKIESGRLEVVLDDVVLGEIIDDVAPDARELCRANANRFVWEAAAAVRVRVDRIRLRQVLLNLLSNAAKFTREGEVRLDVHKVSGGVRIDVVDTGLGMDAAQVGRLFEPFVQVHREGKETFGGTGLGLAISRRLCRMMGGDLTVTSRPGQGSTFSVTLVASGANPGDTAA